MRGWSVWIAGLSAVSSLGRPALGQPATSTSSPPQIHKEWTLGKQIGQDLDRRDGRINDPALTQYIQRIENRLAAAAGQKPLEIRLTRSSEIYATVLENSVPYLSGGFVQRLENETELAGLLAHQLAHRQVSGFSSTPGASTPLHGSPCGLSPLGTAGEGGPRRDQEEQASALALGYLKAASYDPEGLLDLFSKLAYEHPVWAQAIVPEDLLSLRSRIEDEETPSSGYCVNTSEFSERHDNLQAFLGHASDKRQDNQNLPTLTRR